MKWYTRAVPELIITPEMREYLRREMVLDDLELPITTARVQRGLLEMKVEKIEAELRRIKKMISELEEGVSR